MKTKVNLNADTYNDESMTPEEAEAGAMMSEEDAVSMMSEEEDAASMMSEEEDAGEVMSEEEDAASMMSEEEDAVSMMSEEEDAASMMSEEEDAASMMSEEDMGAESGSWEGNFGEHRIKVPARRGDDRRISLPFMSSDKINAVWNWSDLDYANSNEDPNLNLTVMGLILASNIECLIGENAWSLVESNLNELGFQNIVHYYFEKEEDISCAGMVFARSKEMVHGKYVVAAIYRGTSSLSDAISDVKSQLDGFVEAGSVAVNKLREYIYSQELTMENTTLFITGHSYGAANASLVGIQSTDLAERDSIFCYPFATPNYYRNGLTGEGMKMFSFDSSEDIVPHVPVGDDLDKTGIDIIYDRVEMQKSHPEQYQRFRRIYRYFRHRDYEKDFDFISKEFTGNSGPEKIREDSEIIRNHMPYTYMALILSELPDEVIDTYIGKEDAQKGE